MRIFSNRTGGFIPALILAVMLVIGITAPKTYAQYGNGQYGNEQYGNDQYGDQYGNYGDMNYQNFYDELSPYGQWMNDPQYGYVWAPNVGRDFRPYYSNGYWMMTDYGNMWMSNYNWGWAPFHYGRWTLSNGYGWVWIPGNEWGPAWVTWRQGGGNYGWAPMGPGININISFGSGYNVPNPWWTFIPCGNIYSRNFQRYYSPRQTVNIINNTTIINNTYVDARARTTYVSGPRRADVEAVTRQKVTVYNVGNRSKAGSPSVSGRTVSIYRPAVTRNTATGSSRQASAPKQFKKLDRSVATTPGARQSGTGVRSTTGNGQRNQDTRIAQPQNQGTRSGTTRQQVDPQTSRQLQQRTDAQQVQRNQQVQEQQQRNQQQQQQRAQQQQVQRNQQIQQQQEQQRNQQLQQQRSQQQEQRNQQIQQQQEQQRNQQMQQQRMQQQQDQQRNQQMQQQQRSQQQQMQQQRSQQQQPQRSVQQPQPQRVERSAPAPRSAPATDRSVRGR
jgi:hypothetical protein